MSRWMALSAGLILVFGAGCRMAGRDFERRTLPPGTPAVETVLADLAANEAGIQNFRGPCSFTLESPKLAATQVLQKSTVYFRRPTDLCVVGRKYGSTVVRLTCVGPEFLVEIPPENEYYYRLEGERVESVDFSVSPADIAHEMFMPETWGTLDAGCARVSDFDPASQRITLEILDARKKNVLRVVTVSGPPWVVVRNERYDADERLIAVTESGDYRDIDGVYMPTWVEAMFPLENTRMRLDFRQIRPNTEIEAAYFDIAGRARELGIILDRSTSEAQHGTY